MPGLARKLGGMLVSSVVELWKAVGSACVPIVTTEPYVAWARVATLFFPVPPAKPGVHPSAVVADSEAFTWYWVMRLGG